MNARAQARAAVPSSAGLAGSPGPAGSASLAASSAPADSAGLAASPNQAGSVSLAASPDPVGSAGLAASPDPAGSAGLAASLDPAGSAGLAASPDPADSVSLAASPDPVGSVSLAASSTSAGSASLTASLTPAGSANLAALLGPAGSASLAASLTPAGSASLTASLTPAGSANLAASLTPAGSASLVASPRIDRARLLARLAELATVGALDGGGVARLALTDADRDARDLVVGWMKALGLTVTVDAIGNVVGVRAGREDGPPVMTGSHIDTVRTGGRYDGNLGVLAGLEVIAALNDTGVVTRRPLAVAFFTNEEGARFQPDMMGSLVYQGGLALETALDTVGIDGTRVRENLHRIGYAGPAPVGANRVHAYVELHVEQGPLLEHEGATIGAVTGVQGIHWTEFTLEGVSNHAGTTPMALRHDAGFVAAEIASFARRAAREAGGAQLATVGHVSLAPNLVNVIPQRAVFTLDLRNTDADALAATVQRVFDFAQAAAHAEGVKLSRRSLADFAPVAFDERIVGRVEALARAHGHRVRRIPSGAGHDAQIIARMCPTGMIFVPSVAGLSHNVNEFTHDADVEAGASLLLALLCELANEP